jgi:hypothetical protein
MKQALGSFSLSSRGFFIFIKGWRMRWKLWLSYLRARNIYKRTWRMVPLSKMAEAKEKLGIDLPIDEEAVRETAENKDPFSCAACGSEVQTSSVEVTDISPYVIRSVRRGLCPACGMEAELENRFYEGQMAAMVNGEWHVMLVVPSGIDRIRQFFSG